MSNSRWLFIALGVRISNRRTAAPHGMAVHGFLSTSSATPVQIGIHVWPAALTFQKRLSSPWEFALSSTTASHSVPTNCFTSIRKNRLSIEFRVRMSARG